MKNIIFVCHGNICRSPAAEWIMKQLLEKYGLQDGFKVWSRAISNEEAGNDIYPPMKRALFYKGIPFGPHKAKAIAPVDYNAADYIFYMDKSNEHYLNMLLDDHSQKLHPIYEFTPSIETIEDPWYTGTFDDVVEKIQQCCEDILYNISRR